MKAFCLVLLTALLALVAIRPASAADLCVALIEYDQTASEEKIARDLPELDVSEVGKSDKVKTRVKALNGGDVLFFTRVPATAGRQFTRLGVQRSELEYSVKGDTITAQLVLGIGTKLPSGQVGVVKHGGSSTVSGSSAVLLDSTVRNQENTMRSHGSRRTIRSKSFRILVAQIVR